MISGEGTASETSDAGSASSRRAHEQRPARTVQGPPAAVAAVVALAVAVVLILLGAGSALTVVGIVVACVVLLLAPDFVVVQPNEARVLILFGRYVGTVSQAGLWWVNPFIEIAAVVVWRSEAIRAARKTMVLGAVGLVQMAFAQLADSDLVELDAERKAAVVSHLMVVLSRDHSPAPVVNTGSLYT